MLSLFLMIFFVRQQSYQPDVSAQSNCPKKIMGDADCNGTINNTDFDIWKTEFLGQSVSIVPTTTNSRLPCPTNFARTCTPINSTTSTVSISWSPVTNATRYVVRVNKDPYGDWIGTGDIMKYPVLTNESFVVDNGVKYVYDVESQNPSDPPNAADPRCPWPSEEFTCSATTSPTPTTVLPTATRTPTPTSSLTNCSTCGASSSSSCGSCPRGSTCRSRRTTCGNNTNCYRPECVEREI